MHTDDHHHDKSTGGAYERSDLDISMLVKMGTALVVMTVLSYIVCIPIIQISHGNIAQPHWGEGQDTPVNEAAIARREPFNPDFPALQDRTAAEADISIMRHHENEVLEKGAVNPETKEQSIPIEEAMDEEARSKGQ